MRADRVGAHRLWVGALVGIIGLGSGCKKQEAAPEATAGSAGTSSPAAASAPLDAGTRDAGVAASPDKPLRYSTVKLAHDGKSVKLTYGLANLGPKRIRGVTCLRLHDAQGAFIDNLYVGPLSLKAGDSDVFEDEGKLDVRFWKQVRSVQLFASKTNCTGLISPELSPTLHLDTAGQPLGADAPKPQEDKRAMDGSSPFTLSDVRMTQAGNTVSITYQVKNTGSARASASGCLRGFQSEDCGCALEENALESFSLPPGGSEVITEEVILNDEKHWDDLTFFQVSVSPYGCGDTAAEVASHMTRFDKPPEIHGPSTEYDGDGDGDGDGERTGPPPEDLEGDGE